MVQKTHENEEKKKTHKNQINNCLKNNKNKNFPFLSDIQLCKTKSQFVITQKRTIEKY